MGSAGNKTLFVFVDSEKQKQSATEFFNRALAARDVPLPRRRLIPGQEAVKGYTHFEIVVAAKPARPSCLGETNAVWYSIGSGANY